MSHLLHPLVMSKAESIGSSHEDVVGLEPTWKTAIANLSSLISDVEKKLDGEKREELQRKHLDLMDSIRLLSEGSYQPESESQQEQDITDAARTEISDSSSSHPILIDKRLAGLVYASHVVNTKLTGKNINSTATEPTQGAGSEAEQRTRELDRSLPISSPIPQEEEKRRATEGSVRDQSLIEDQLSTFSDASTPLQHDMLFQHARVRQMGLPTPPMTPQIQYGPGSIGHCIPLNLRLQHTRRSLFTEEPDHSHQSTPSQSAESRPLFDARDIRSRTLTVAGRVALQSPSIPSEGAERGPNETQETPPISTSQSDSSLRRDADSRFSQLPRPLPKEQKPCNVYRDKEETGERKQDLRPDAEHFERRDGLKMGDSWYSPPCSSLSQHTSHQQQSGNSQMSGSNDNSDRSSSELNTLSGPPPSTSSTKLSLHLVGGNGNHQKAGQPALRQQSKSPKVQEHHEDVHRGGWSSMLNKETTTSKAKAMTLKTDGEAPINQILDLRGNATGLSLPDSRILLKLVAVFEDVVLYKQFLSCSKDDAQTVIDAFQEVLDARDLAHHLQRQLIIAMQRLSEGLLYPLSFDFQGSVQVLEDYPSTFGSYADIYKAQRHGELLCLKVSRAHTTSDRSMAKMHAREAILWGQLLHPNVLPFYGLFLFRGSRIALVSPWAENGQLNDFLDRNPDANRMLLWLDTAVGLNYLHERAIVHGDLKSSNVLVDDSGRARLSDFGLSSPTDSRILWCDPYSSLGSKGGSIRWQAPELHEPESDDVQPGKIIHNSTASDIFAWGCLGYEIFAEHVPYFETTVPARVMRRIISRGLPTKPVPGSPAWTERGLTYASWDLMEYCWKFLPQQRPSISEIISRLDPEVPEDTRPQSQWHSRPLTQAQDPRTLGDLDKILSRLTIT